MNLDLQSHKAQLIATAVAASAATIGVISAYNQYSRRRKRLELHDHISRSIVEKGRHSAPHSPITLNSKLPAPFEINESALGNGYDEELVREQLARNYAFFGEEGMAKIRKGNVVVVGCGGVGSWAAVMLVRS